MMRNKLRLIVKPNSDSERLAESPVTELILHEQIVCEHNTLCQIVKKLNELVSDPAHTTQDYIKALKPIAELIECELSLLNARDAVLKNRTGLSAIRPQSEAQ